MSGAAMYELVSRNLSESKAQATGKVKSIRCVMLNRSWVVNICINTNSLIQRKPEVLCSTKLGFSTTTKIQIQNSFAYG